MTQWPHPGQVLTVGPAGAEEGHCVAASQDGFVATFTNRTKASEFSKSTVMRDDYCRKCGGLGSWPGPEITPFGELGPDEPCEVCKGTGIAPSVSGTGEKP